MEAPKAAKKRKLTDKTLPASVLQSSEFPDSKMYQDLLEMERKLDWTMMRKKTTRTLRIFLSHTVSDQAWQTEGLAPPEAHDFDTGKGIPSWAFKFEGRLLEVPGRRDKGPLRKFSSFIKSLVVDLDRDQNLYPDGNIVEWHRPQVVSGIVPPSLDGFTVRRTGDTPTKVRVTLHLEHYPEQYRVNPDLGSILDLKEESRTGVITALWNYIKINGLQDKVDRRVIRTDARLKAIFGVDQLPFQQIPELVNRYLHPPDPVILHYTLKPNEPPPVAPQAWDVEVKVEDTSLKSKMTQVVLSMNAESMRELARLDDEIALLAQQIHNSQLKRNFLTSFAENPAEFIQTWLESQSRDLESVLGSGPSEGQTVREEELKRSEFFRLPWVEEAVAVQEGMRMASKGLM
ncbi:SWI/SNF complex protein [Rickenella mellea]|uniref:SWI/SNF complex protein n=1 Tax=Rickenella mellea TaxID=50990 RepID=A0A4Y7PKA8_9AGAM|nr:SWI/SNF complex protein [Rickenella mellea]